MRDLRSLININTKYLLLEGTGLAMLFGFGPVGFPKPPDSLALSAGLENRYERSSEKNARSVFRRTITIYLRNESHYRPQKGVIFYLLDGQERLFKREYWFAKDESN